MTPLEAIRESVAATSAVEPMDDGICVITHCLYPSNSAVRVMVRGGDYQCLVSDEGGATDEAASAGLNLRGSYGQLLGMVRRQGLRTEKGVIYSPPVPLAHVGAAVLLVANASKDAAHRLLDHLRVQTTRNFRQALADLLERRFSQELHHDLPIVGASNKPHKFDHVVILSGGRRLLIDPVSRESTSINARVVANLDVKNVGDPSLAQRIVYDDEEKWPAADLNLLQFGAPIVPFSRVPEMLERLVQ